MLIISVDTSNPQVIVIADTIQLYPPALYERGLDVVTASTMRNHPAALNPRIKSLNYLNNIMAKIEGTDAGCVEALMLNHKGEIAECSGDNIFLVKHGLLLTPPNNAGILEGVTTFMGCNSHRCRFCRRGLIRHRDLRLAPEGRRIATDHLVIAADSRIPLHLPAAGDAHEHAAPPLA